MEEYIVKMEHICKAFPGVKALDDVSFNLKPGEVMALLGENGAGKSTLMKILSGIYTKDEGSIWVNGKDIPVMNQRVASENGETVYEDDDKCIKAETNKTGGWSYATVDWKNIKK